MNGISTWNQRLDEQVRRKYDCTKTIRINLDAALVNKEFPIPGDQLLVIDASSADAVASLRFVRNDKEPIALYQGKKISTVFTSIFISCSAQANKWLDLQVSIDCDIDQVNTPDMLANAIGAVVGTAGCAQPCNILTNASPGVNTTGSPQACKRVVLKALPSNAGNCWLNFQAAAVIGSTFPMTPGSVISIVLTDCSYINVMFETGGDKLAVVYVL